ncbi:MAG: ATP-binding protein [Elusimicrobiota bacterium]|nr:ATP-binding protein [Elusimicrobiota bacterium]
MLTNSVQAIESNGEITISTKSPSPEYIEIEIADNGKGISKNIIGKIFNGSFSSGQGIGLGLYISREIVKKHNGDIYAFSDGINKGARFVVRLSTKFFLGK